MTTWAGERLENFKALYDSTPTLSFTLMAAQMGGGITRNALIGVAHRQGWQPRGRGPSQSLPRVRKTRVKTRAAYSVLPYRRSPVPIAPTPPPEPEVITMKHMIRFMEAENHHCHWPLWGDDTPFEDKFYCGTPTANVLDSRPYCAGHAESAVTPSTYRGAKPAHPWKYKQAS